MLSHVTPSELILAAFTLACGALPLLAEWRPGRRRPRERDDDPELPLPGAAA